MGVPGFFAWLLKKYKKSNFILKRSDVGSLDYLLIDMNCMIHPVCFETLAQNKIDVDKVNMEKLEAKMRNNVIAYLENTISQASPTKGIYIAIDGVAPVAKMKQQRLRRYKSVSDKALYDKIRAKHNKPNPLHWNNSAITPGTEFMHLLTLKLEDWASKYSKKYKLEIIFSSSNVPGEGEHKLLQYIRTNTVQYN